MVKFTKRGLVLHGWTYLANIPIQFIVLILVQWLFARAIPFGTFEFWRNLQIIQGLKYAWILFAWGLLLALTKAVVTRYDRKTHALAERIAVKKAGTALLAGVAEEIGFRWIFFLNGIWVAKLMNWLFFGFAGFGVIEWLYKYIMIPIVNLLTLGKMTALLHHPYGWFVAAAMIAANTKFRDGHKYQGWFGFINSWFVGMFFFWLLFQAGLIACMLVHLLYDLLIDLIWYIDVRIEKIQDKRRRFLVSL